MYGLIVALCSELKNGKGAGRTCGTPQGEAAQKEISEDAPIQQNFQCDGAQVQQAIRSVHSLEDPNQGGKVAESISRRMQLQATSQHQANPVLL